MPHTNLPLRELLALLRREQSAMLELLGRMVRIESPSYEKSAVDEFGRMIAAEWRKRGAKINVLKRGDRGNIIRAELWLGHGRPAGQLLILGHLDTVYERGTLARMPYRISKGRAWGPATFDMKGGHVLALFAAAALQRAKISPQKKFVFLWNSDEEIGSKRSRAAIESEARRSDAVLVLEPAFGRRRPLQDTAQRNRRSGNSGHRPRRPRRNQSAGRNQFRSRTSPANPAPDAAQ